MTTMYEKVCEFQQGLNKPKPSTPKFPDQKIRDLHHRLLSEEYTELLEAESNNDLVNVSEEIADMIYILCGMACKYGIPLDDVFNGIHDANMRKINIPGGPVLKNGKLAKPIGWTKSNSKKILENIGWTSE